MASQKRLDVDSCSSSSSDANKKQKRQIFVPTFNRWQLQYNREHCTLLWLRCEKDADDRKMVSMMWCSVCRQYELFLTGHKLFKGIDRRHY